MYNNAGSNVGDNIKEATMKKRIFIVLGILIAAGGIGGGVWYHFNGNGQGSSSDSIVYVSKVSLITGT